MSENKEYPVFISAVSSSIEVAYWFMLRFQEKNDYLQPYKLQRLLYLSQAYYVALKEGVYLFPSLFLADELGPLDAGVYNVFQYGIPPLENPRFTGDVETFLQAIIRRFGGRSAQALMDIIHKDNVYRKIYEKTPGSVIPLEMLHRVYKEKSNASNIANQLETSTMRILHNQYGKPCSVTSWIPQKK